MRSEHNHISVQSDYSEANAMRCDGFEVRGCSVGSKSDSAKVQRVIALQEC